MALVSFNNLSEVDKTRAIEKLISQSTPSQDFFFMMALSVLMATFGILIDSIPVIIGSMLIAPLLSPILSLSLGIIMSDGALMARSVRTIVRSMILAVVAAAVATLLFGNGEVASDILAALEPSFIYMAIAIIAGFAASFALVKPKLNETLPGVAIAVALIPPLALIGVGAAKWSWEMMTGAFVIFLLNAIGIIFASMITFSLMHFYVKRRIARVVVREEEEKLRKEKEMAGEKRADVSAGKTDEPPSGLPHMRGGETSGERGHTIRI